MSTFHLQADIANRSLHSANRVSANKFRILKIRERRLAAKTAGVLSEERELCVAETFRWAPKPRNCRTFFLNDRNGLGRQDWLAEGAVQGEPVSPSNSLLTGENTGKFAQFAPRQQSFSLG